MSTADDRPFHSGQAQLLSPDTIEVTPAGHDLARWADERPRAERLDLDGVLDRLGIGHRTGVPLVVLAAHPDDETLGLGRLIHRWGRTLGPVCAIVATAGEACFDHVGERPVDLATRRLAEWQQAMAIIGVTHTEALGLPDGGLTGVEPTLVSALETVIGSLPVDRQRMVLACPWRGDPHPDHRAVGRAAGALAERHGWPVLEFAVWMTYWSDPADLAADQRRLGVLVTDDADEEAHRRGCAAFATQLQPLAPALGPVVPPAMLAHHHEQLLVLPDLARIS